jgi:hypothetical protein
LQKKILEKIKSLKFSDVKIGDIVYTAHQYDGLRSGRNTAVDWIWNTLWIPVVFDPNLSESFYQKFNHYKALNSS